MPLWLAIVQLEADAATVNLRAPIVVNPRRMIGVQLLRAQSPCSCEQSAAFRLIAMLVVTRNRDEVIGDGIEGRILRVGGDVVHLGVTAPPDVPVHRHEIYQMVGTANLSAAGNASVSSAAPDTSIVERLATRLRRDRGTDAANG